MNKCLTCGKDVKNKYCNVSCQNRNKDKNRFENIRIKKYGEFKTFNVNCYKCKRPLLIKERENLFPLKSKYYCNRSCANSRQQNIEANGKRSSSLKKYFPPFEKNCRQCNLKISFSTHGKLLISLKRNSLCRNCLTNNRKLSGFYKITGSIGGKLSAKIQSEIRRSKNEIYFSDLCKTQFSNVLTNKPIFNGWDADVILPDLKIAILWNGKWHYEKITKKHSIEQVQNRDKIKLDEITKMGYTLYTIKDMGKFNKTFVNDEFQKFLEFVNKSLTSSIV